MNIAIPHNVIMYICVSCRGVRPFGVSLLIAGYDEDTPYLFQCDPSVNTHVYVCNECLYVCCSMMKFYFPVTMEPL